MNESRCLGILALVLFVAEADGVVSGWPLVLKELAIWEDVIPVGCGRCLGGAAGGGG